MIRKIKTKWWDNFNFTKNATEEAILAWLNNHNNQNRPIQAAQSEAKVSFLQQKSLVTAPLAAGKSQDEYINTIEQLSAGPKSSKSSSSQSRHSGNTNEDNYHGILSLVNLLDTNETCISKRQPLPKSVTLICAQEWKSLLQSSQWRIEGAILTTKNQGGNCDNEESNGQSS